MRSSLNKISENLVKGMSRVRVRKDSDLRGGN